MMLIVFLAILGFICLYIEFFLPGGVFALLGGGILLGSIVVFGLQAESFIATFFYVVAIVLVAAAVCFFALKWIRKSGRNDSFFLEKDQAGFSIAQIDPLLIGKFGIVTTELKPAGHVRIEQSTYQAICPGQFVPKDGVVEVVEVKASHVVVKYRKEKGDLNGI